MSNTTFDKLNKCPKCILPICIIILILILIEKKLV